METVTFTNSMGQSVKFADAPFFIQNVTGLGDVTADIQSVKSAYEDGSNFIDAILNEREIELSFLIVADAVAKESYGDISRMREHVATVLNPKLGPGTLKYENERVVRLITCVADSVPQFPDSGGRVEMIQNASVTFIAHDPYWRSTEIIEEPMAAFVELFEFPFDGEFEMGTEGHNRTFSITGNAEVPLEIKIIGPCEKPKLTNKTTGKSIQINYDLTANDVLEINTDNREKSVLLNGSNAFHLVDLSTVFWKLGIGENEIQFTAESGMESARLEIKWQERYLAI